MSLESENIALRCEAEGLRTELARVRAENDHLRKHQVEARHHLALALRAMNGESPDTQRFHNGG